MGSYVNMRTAAHKDSEVDFRLSKRDVEADAGFQTYFHLCMANSSSSGNRRLV